MVAHKREARVKLSTKGRYAVTALADIALQGGDKLVTLAEIAARAPSGIFFTARAHRMGL